MDTGVGATLREARNRRKLELSEVEAAIKIRVRYLQAIEHEEWDVLPGVAYTRGFIRTYAYYLGLDGERLADDYRRSIAPPGVPKRIEPVPTGARRRGGRRLSGPAAVVAVCLVLVALVVGIGLAGGDGDSPPPVHSPAAKDGRRQGGTQAGDRNRAVRSGVAMRLTTTAEVWVCLIDASQRALVDGEILDEGEEAGPFRSEGFEVALGNGSVEMFVDDKQIEIAESSSPVGYRIDSDGKPIELEEGERPDCE